MSWARRCDARCHKAKCACWCGGVFHGAKGQHARDAFKAAFGGDVPAEEPQNDLFFGSAMAAARDAKLAASP